MYAFWGTFLFLIGPKMKNYKRKSSYWDKPRKKLQEFGTHFAMIRTQEAKGARAE